MFPFYAITGPLKQWSVILLKYLEKLFLSLNFGLLASYLFGMTHKDFAFASLESSAFVVVFPIIGSFLQLLILSFVYDSPDSLGTISKKIILI